MMMTPLQSVQVDYLIKTLLKELLVLLQVCYRILRKGSLRVRADVTNSIQVFSQDEKDAITTCNKEKLEQRRLGLAKRQLALGENIMLHRAIRQKAENNMIKAQRLHIQSQLSSLGTTDPQIMKQKMEQIAQSLGLD